MSVNTTNSKRLLILVGVLLLICSLIAALAATGVQYAQAGPNFARKTRTPKPVASPTNAPTQTPVSYATPTPGPTTSVDGTWKIVSSPNVGTGTHGNVLNGVAVVSPNDVWAVGFSPHPSGTPLYIRQSLVEHWNGSDWSVVASPNPAGKPDVVLNGVAAISANDIWAVGHSGDPAFAPWQTLTEHWDGTTWSIVPSPSPGTYNGNDLYAVAAVSTNDVWAVGWYQSGPTGQIGGALTMHWDGTSWTVIPNPSRSPLYGVSAVSANDVWAVGDQTILHWNGTNWSVVSFPPPPTSSYPLFRAITAISANDIWAVGYGSPIFAYGRPSPISYHWNGTNWSFVPNAGSFDEYFHAVSAIASNDVWAVGDNGQTQHWNGANWSRVTAPFPGLGGRFKGVAAASASDVWAVGFYSSGTQTLTWIDRYTIP